MEWFRRLALGTVVPLTAHCQDHPSAPQVYAADEPFYRCSVCWCRLSTRV